MGEQRHRWEDAAFLPVERVNPQCWTPGVRFLCECGVERRVAGEVTFYMKKGRRLDWAPECTR